MAPVHKFLFDRSFDEPRPSKNRRGNDAVAAAAVVDAQSAAVSGALAGAGGTEEADGYVGPDRRQGPPEEPAPPPAEMFTKEQLEAAREEGFIRGHTSALDDAAKADGHVTASALKRIAEGIGHMDEAERSHLVVLDKMATRLALTIARQILPATAERVAVDEIKRLVEHVLPDLLDQPRLVIRVNGAIAEVVRGAVRELQASSGYEGRVVVRPDNALAWEDCRLEWGEGGTERDTARLWADIESAVARHLDEPVPPATPRPAPAADHPTNPTSAASGGGEPVPKAETP